MENYTVTILGCGVMGTAVLASVLKSSFEPYPKKFICCTGSAKSAEKLKETYGDKIEVSYGASNVEAVRKADVIILGCKPFLCQSIMQSVSSGLNHSQLIISLLAGWTIKQLEAYSPYIARVMTNTPAKYGCGMAIVSFSHDALQYEDLVMKLVNTVGKALKLPERNMDAATSLVGSGPAFCLVMMEALAEGGVRMGIPYNIAKECAAKVMEGTAKMVMETGMHPEALKAQVCTPGGTTIGGLMVMEDKAVRSGISRAVEEAAKIAAELGKK
ncbi:DEKNAAC105570 [Brettanomyces naardenensis]|uniref:Pyrroline-5-carboxylate reductase n=1 Tax=Brettanomyces naardenensis TaxID=13370 RepID=A0A448YTL1_BRENA|nr:DEKNAAC105570 [Brettanomyces naardenensis]